MNNLYERLFIKFDTKGSYANMILRENKPTGANSNIISELLTTFLRIKNRRKHKERVLRYSRHESLANVDSAYLYLADLLNRNRKILDEPAIIQDTMGKNMQIFILKIENSDNEPYVDKECYIASINCIA